MNDWKGQIRLKIIGDPPGNGACGGFFRTQWRTICFNGLTVSRVFIMTNKRTGFQLTLLTVFFIAAFSVLPANAQGPQGSISGFIVQSSGGTGIPGVEIQIYDSFWNFVSSTATDSSGFYHTELPVGNYYIHTSNDLGYIDRYFYTSSYILYYNRSYASAIAVTEGTDTTIPNIALPTGASSISGRVTDDSSGDGLAGFTVNAYTMIPGSSFISATAVTDADGYYIIHGLARQVLVSGSWYMTQSIFVGTDNNTGYIDEYYPDTVNSSDARPVGVASGMDTGGIDFGLRIGGSVTGRVTSASDGEGLANSTVSFTKRGNVLSDKNVLPTVRTDSDGYFSMNGLEPETYMVSADSNGYITRYYDNTIFYGATMITVETDATVPDIDIELEPGGSISGRVTRESDGTGVSTVYFWIYNIDETVSSFVSSNGNGYFSATELPAGDYYITTTNIPAGGLTFEYYQDAVTLGKSSLVHLDPQQNRNDIEIELDDDSSISGTVTRETGGSTISDVTVRAYDSKWNAVRSVKTNSSGNYTLTGLHTGDYFIGTDNTPGYIDKFFSNTTLRSGASVVAVAGNQDITNINFVLPAGGAIAGTVLRSYDQSPIPSLPIEIYNSEWVRVKSGRTFTNGGYIINGLAPGDYFVRAEPVTRYVGEYYGDALHSTSAAPVTVVQVQRTEDIDFQLEDSPAIYGKVVSFFLNNRPLEGIQVYAYDSSWEPAGSSITDVTGRYVIEGLAPGKYYVKTQNDQGYMDQYCDKSADPDSATQVYLQYDPIGINFVLLKKLMPDFDRDENADILWRNGSNGEIRYWSMDGATRLGSEHVDTVSDLNWKIAAEADFNRDGWPDILWRNLTTGENTIWFMNGATRTATASIPSVSDANWTIVGSADFNDDGWPDILWRNPSTGKNTVWYMNGATRTATASIPSVSGAEWRIAGAVDFDADGDPDIVWRNQSTGSNALWYMDGIAYSGTASLPAVADTDWRIIRINDYNGDRKPDILWHNAITGQNCIYYMDGTVNTGAANIQDPESSSWRIFDFRSGNVTKADADFNGDGKADILWRNQSNGKNTAWLMNGTAVSSSVSLSSVSDTNWTIVGAADFNADGKTDILWRNTSNGKNTAWLMNGTSVSDSVSMTTVSDASWTIVGTPDLNGDGKPDILWRNSSNGKNTVWLMNGTSVSSSVSLSSVSDTSWTIAGAADFNADGKTDILWHNTSSGKNTVWLMNSTAVSSSVPLTTVSDVNWTIAGAMDLNGDGKPDILWRNMSNGKNTAWLMNGTSVSSSVPLTTVSDVNWMIVP
jgi:hypothetical protein